MARQYLYEDFHLTLKAASKTYSQKLLIALALLSHFSFLPALFCPPLQQMGEESGLL